MFDNNWRWNNIASSYGIQDRDDRIALGMIIELSIYGRLCTPDDAESIVRGTIKRSDARTQFYKMLMRIQERFIENHSSQLPVWWNDRSEAC